MAYCQGCTDAEREAASLRQRLEEAEKRTDCGHHRDVAIWRTRLNELEAQLAQAQQELQRGRRHHEQCDVTNAATIQKLTDEVEQAEAALEEMQKRLDDFDGWLKFQECAAIDSISSDDFAKARAELQRRRSPTEKVKS